MSQKGITLISLVITIIILLILAGISTKLIIGNNGILGKSKQVRETYEVSEYEEAIGVSQVDARVSKKELKQVLSSNEMLKEANIADGDNEGEEQLKLIITTKEGYVFIVTEDTVEYIGKKEEIGNMPDINTDVEEGDIKFVCTPSDWTNGNVKVEIKINNTEYEKYKLQYSYDGKNWKTYKTELQIEDNGQAIYVRLTNGIIATDNYAIINVNNIDRIKPKEFAAVATSTSGSITLSGNTEDSEATQIDGISGIATYYFSLDGGTNWVTNEEMLQTSYTFANLPQNTQYTLKMKAVDKAGNYVETETITLATGKVPNLDIEIGNVQFNCTPSEWTNQNVNVEITTTETGYTLQYSTDLENWTDYVSAVSITENGAIYARLTDGTNVGEYATANINNIDKTLPTIESITSSLTIVDGNTGTIQVSGIEDTGGSELKGYYISTSSTKPTKDSVTWTIYTQSSFTYSVTAAGTYYIWILDNAGNVSEAKTCIVTVHTAIAKVNTTYYSSIASAVSAISSSGTVTMCANTTESPTIPSGKTIVLNLNSKTVTGTITNRGTLTIGGGNVTGSNALVNYGTLTINSGTYTGNNGHSVYNNSTLTFNGGTITLPLTTGQTALYSNSGTVKMTGGTISSNSYGLVIHGGTGTVTSGTIQVNTGNCCAVLVRNTGSATISSATIKASSYAVANDRDSYSCTLRNTSISGTVTGKVELINTSSTYYTYYVWGVTSSAVKVRFPTWTSANGQDDLIWHEGTKGTVNNSTCWYYTVYKSQHNNESGNYATHVYWYDSAETSTYVTGTGVSM